MLCSIYFSGMNNFTELVSCNGNFFPCLGPELGVGVGMCGGQVKQQVIPLVHIATPTFDI